MKWLITGGAGFIGVNLIRHVLTSHPEDEVVNFDKPTYAGNLASLRDIEADPRYRLIRGDITRPEEVERAFETEIDVVIHLAAESHVDRSILTPRTVVSTNVVGTQTLLDAALKHSVEKFVHVSTDEVYGSTARPTRSKEGDPLQPNSPYASSKAGADLLARAYHRTFGLPVVITRCANNYGPYQFPEKLIPITIMRALAKEPIPVYGDGQQVRDWIHVSDHARAISSIVDNGKVGEVYNISANDERSNIQVVTRILKELGTSTDLIRFVTDRPGHDERYALDSDKFTRELGWHPQIAFDRGLSDTVQWYCKNVSWWRSIQTKEYESYVTAQYRDRLDDSL